MFLSPVKDVIGQFSLNVIGCEDSNSDWLVALKFRSICLPIYYQFVTHVVCESCVQVPPMTRAC